MRRSEEQAALVKGVFSDAYRFYKKYHGQPMDPEFWNKAIKDFDGIMQMYKREDICGRIMLATFSRLEEEVHIK